MLKTYRCSMYGNMGSRRLDIWSAGAAKSCFHEYAVPFLRTLKHSTVATIVLRCSTPSRSEDMHVHDNERAS